MGVDIGIFSPVEGVARSAGEYVFQTVGACCDEIGLPDPRAIMTVDRPRAESSGGQYLVTVRVYRRLLPGESSEDVVGWLEGSAVRTAKEMHAVGIDVTVHEEDQRLYTGHTRRVRLSVPPWSTNLMNPLVGRAREAMLAAGCRWAPNHWRLDRLGIGTAGGVVSRDFGIPVIGYGPGEEEQAHACNESVGLPALVDAVFGTAVLVHGLSTVPMTPPTESVPVDTGRIVACAGEGGSG